MAFDLVSAYASTSDTPFFLAGQSAQTLTEAPQQITLRFSLGAKLDPATLGAISIVRAGADGVLGGADDVNVMPANFVGIVAVDDFPNENQVVVRFAENLPDDLYRLSITGDLKTIANGPADTADSFRNGGRLDVNFRLDLGAQVVSVVPQPITRQANGSLTQDRDTVIVYFNANDPLEPESAQAVGNYRLVETDPVTGADVAVLLPQSVTYETTDASGRRISRATLRFDGDLGDKLYRLQIGGGDDDNGTLAKATVVGTLFQHPDGPFPGFSANSFLGDGLAAANDVDLYKVVLTAGATLTVRISPDAALDAAVRIFDATGAEVAIRDSSGAGTQATLTHTAAGAGEFFVGISSAGNTAYAPTTGTGAAGGTTRGGYRLELSSDASPSASDENSSFGTATALGVLGAGGKTLNAVLDVRPMVPTPLGDLLFPSPPGTIDEPGHREIPILLETHSMPAASLAPAGSTPVFEYNFQTNYGVDGQDNVLVNTITENQKQRTREIFELYSLHTGIRFVETAASGLTVVTGDIRAVDPRLPVPNGPAGICGNGLAIMNGSLDWGESEFGGRWYDVAMHEIGHALGLGHSYDIDSNMGAESPDEGVIPGDYDLVHLSVLLPKRGSDVDVYSFSLDADGKVSLETVVARPGQAVTSFADTVLSLYREDPATGARELLTRNDDFYGRDSFLGIDLVARNQAGGSYTYYVTVTSTGTTFDPSVENSGNDGRSDGAYQLKLGYVPAGAARNTIIDRQGTPIDGDRDGVAGGEFNFWFQSSTAANTIFVDKVAPSGGANGSIARPFTTVEQGLAAVGGATKVVRIVGNGQGSAYLIGTTLAGAPLSDGAEFAVPANVTVMIDEGAIFKLRAQVIDVGSSTPLVSRRGAALQVLGTPDNQVQFTSYHDDTIGGNSDGVGPGRSGGQWGGIVMRADSDSATKRVFLNSISQAVMQYGGGQVRVNGQLQSFAPIHLETARPTLAFNTIRFSAGAAVSADPNSFEETADRRGPMVRGNRLVDNSINGLFVRIRTQFGQPIDTLDVPAAFASRDITYVLAENLLINGGVGGYDATSGTPLARATGRLMIDAGVVVKLQGARIELGRGNAQLIAEGDPQKRVIFTSAADNRFGAGGTFDVFGTQTSQPAAGDWGGIVVNAAAQASIDNAHLAYGGGQTSIEGGFDNFNLIEVHQGRLRLANSRIENNASGQASTTRSARGTNAAATIFVRGAQPIIVGNDFRGNAGALVSINVNSLSDLQVPDLGRSTGPNSRFAQFDDNSGPLVRGNTLAAATPNGGIGGMVVRGGEITVEGVWDDTDIVHVVTSEIVVDNFHSATGLRLMSSPNASLVVKLAGANAGLTATGHGTDIDDRIGGTVQVLGQPGYPVVLTSLEDDSVGASLDPLGATVKDTNGNGPSTGTSGDWRGLRFLPYSNDRNVAVLREAENAFTGGVDANRIPVTAQYLGVLAPNEKGGDDNRRLGFEVHGYVSGDDSTDVDVYSFEGYPGSEVWIDIDKTSATLDTMIELLDASGAVLARSVDSQTDAGLSGSARGIGGDLQKNSAVGLDYYSQNPRDSGMRVILPGSVSVPAQTTQYFVRVRSQPRVAATATTAELEAAVTDPARVRQGATSGRYELRIRLQQGDEKPGSTVRFADIRFPVVGIDVQGLPQHSPLVGENGEAGANESPTAAQNLGNLLATDRNAISVAGALSSATDVDWYAVDLAYEDIQVIGGLSGGLKTWSTVFDIDYADGFRGDLTISVFNAQGQLLYVGRDSDLSQSGAPDQPTAGQGNGFNDLSKGSAGVLDPFIGPAQMPTGLPGNPQRYYVAISSNERLPNVLDATFKSTATNSLVRLEPITSTFRVVEDHIGFQGYHSGEEFSGVDTDDYTHIQPYSGPLFDLPNLEAQLGQVTLDDLRYFLSEQQEEGSPDIIGIPVDDLAMRPDGWLYTYAGVAENPDTAGQLARRSIVGGGSVVVGFDNIPNAPETTFSETNLRPRITGSLPTSTFSLSAANVTATTPLDLPTLTGFVQLTETVGTASVTGNWSFTTDASGAISFTSLDAGGPPAGLATPLGGTADAQGQILINWNAPVTHSTTNPTLSRVDYAVIPDPNPVTTDRVDALAWQRFSALFYSIRDVNADGNETGVSRLYRADVENGDAATGRVGTVIQTETNDLGLTTGMAFVDGTLYGVDDRGNLFTIDVDTAAATLVARIGDLNLQGLTIGPQNVAGGPDNQPGYFADKLFAIDRGGTMWCFDTAGALLPAFASGTSTSRWVGHYDAGGSPVPGNFTGIAFSPIDVNLWRGTTVRGNEAGHGVTVALDHTRDAGFMHDAGTEEIPESSGHASIYYGFDASVGTAADGTSLSHLGVVSPTWASDLASNIGTSVANLPVPQTAITRTGSVVLDSSTVGVSSTTGLFAGMSVTGPGIPAGATLTTIISSTRVTISASATATASNVPIRFGTQSLTTLPFSLEGYTYQDKPTLYFNYRIESGEGSTNVQLSADGGLTWIIIATNSHARSRLDAANAALPNFASVSSRIGQQPNQLAQELFENTGWRQARIDIGDFAGSDDIRLRFNFVPTPNASGNCEGIYLDDFVVGFAERGEVVTGATADQTGFFTIGTPESFTTPRQNLQGPYQLEIRRGTEVGELTDRNSSAVQIDPAMMIDTHAGLVRGVVNPDSIVPGSQLRGDDNNPRDQGQFIIENNSIISAANYGIRIDAEAREAGTNAPIAGVVRNLPVTNATRLVPGVVVVNNIVSTSGQAGILFSGDPNAGAGPMATVPYGRIVNNTIYGGESPQGVGVVVSENAGPTLLNNLFANLATGVNVGTSSQATTVIGASAFYAVGTQVSGGTQSQQITLASNPFVNAAGRNFYLAAGSHAIDSSVNSLLDRSAFVAVTSPLGIPQSPILTPDRDLYGQLRGDDPSQASAAGIGSNVFKDRGAVERIDFAQPYAALAVPLDNATSDQEPAADRVSLVRSDARSITQFVLQLDDLGAGIDKSTVTSEAFSLRRNGSLLIAGTDYSFNYLESVNRVVFESNSVFSMGSYVITVAQALVNGVAMNVVTDLAGNPLLPNQADGTTSFTIELADVPTAPTGLVATPGDGQASLVWNAATSDGTPLLRYQVQRATADTFAGATTTDVDDPAAVSTVVTGLVNNTLYWFRIRAVNAVGESDWSNVAGPVAPSTPPTLALGAGVDNGATSAEATQASGVVTVSGESGATIVVIFRRGGGAPVTKTVVGTGATQPVVLTNADLSTLGNGAISVSATQSLVAGSTSAAATTNFTLDTAPPTAPALALGTGVANGASAAEATQASGVVTVSGESGAAIVVIFQRGTGTPVTKNLVGTGAPQPVVLTNADLVTLGDGTISVSATQTDAAGNAQTGAAASSSFALDTVPPAAPALALGSGIANGASAAEATQASGVVTVSGESGAAIVVTFQRGAGTPVTKNLVGTGAPQPVVLTNADLAMLGDGLISVSATQADGVGNASVPAAASFTLDTTPPAPPTLAFGIGIANGATALEATQASGVVTVSGESGAAITVTFQRGAGTPVTKNLVGTGAAQPVVLTNADLAMLGDGTISISATQADEVGNTSASATSSFTLDTTPPAAPRLALVAGVANGATLAEATRSLGVVTVTGEAGATIVVVFRQGAGAPVTKTVTGTGVSQPVILTAADVSTLGNGLVSVSTTQTDAVGNAQTAAASTSSFTLDTVRPTVLNVTSSLPNGTYASGQEILIQVVFREPAFVTGTPGLLLNTTPQRTATYASGSGSTALMFRYTVVAGDTSADLNYASRTALAGGKIADAAGNLAIATLPALAGAGSLATNKNIVIDGSLQAVASGFSTSPDGPGFSTAVRSVPITFTAPVTGVSIASFQLYYEGRLVSLRGATVSGSGTTWTLSLPSTTTNLRGRYRLDIGGPTSGIQANGVVMSRVTSIYWQRA